MSLTEIIGRQETRRGLAQKLTIAYVDEHGEIIGFPTLVLDDLDETIALLKESRHPMVPNLKPNFIKIPLATARVSRQVVFTCGCIADYPMIGEYSDKQDWHVIPCFAHAEQREVVSRVAQEVWVNKLIGEPSAADSLKALS